MKTLQYHYCHSANSNLVTNWLNCRTYSCHREFCLIKPEYDNINYINNYLSISGTWLESVWKSNECRNGLNVSSILIFQHNIWILLFSYPSQCVQNGATQLWFVAIWFVWEKEKQLIQFFSFVLHFVRIVCVLYVMTWYACWLIFLIDLYLLRWFNHM